jgi:hypothetical protein
MNSNEVKTFSQAGGHALLWEAIALAKVVEGKVLNAGIEELTAAFAGCDYFKGEDMPGLCTALRKKIEEIEKIAEASS